MPSQLNDCLFLKAARCEPTPRVPMWIMRQAGRYLKEYRDVRSKVTFIELCKRPDLATEVTVTAQRVLGVDAAILFADLLPILEPMGFDLEYAQGEGPVIHNPLKSAADVDRVKVLEDLGSLHFVFDTVRQCRRELPADIPLLGFAGAPFTLASYVIEGSGSRNYIRTKTLMHTDRGAWATLMERLIESLERYLKAQIEAGCQAVQVFDSWAGCLSPRDYVEFVQPYTKRLIAAVSPLAPVINFVTGNPALLGPQSDAGGQVLGIDWRCDLADVRKQLGPKRAVQGNLDPVTLFASQDELKRQVTAVLEAGRGPGHIFNLGHGVLPETPEENVKALVHMVRDLSSI
ncbi:MAG TPA: uroporphyrinogen decarboxylase [Caulifigura sp.]|jgi:uroporphyrinogen decarboxylase|nr:uroporphyrinogen decarboxylase [Caulifigura sp.]